MSLVLELKAKMSLVLNILRKYRLQQFVRNYKQKNIGEKFYVDLTVHVVGWENVRIGRHSVISQDTWANVNHP